MPIWQVDWSGWKRPHNPVKSEIYNMEKHQHPWPPPPHIIITITIAIILPNHYCNWLNVLNTLGTVLKLISRWLEIVSQFPTSSPPFLPVSRVIPTMTLWGRYYDSLILHKRKLKIREIKCLSQNHIGNKWESWGSGGHPLYSISQLLNLPNTEGACGKDLPWVPHFNPFFF